ncbi:hypothetical protein V8F44DRAFT_661250 [Aspergillus fumigatus]
MSMEFPYLHSTDNMLDSVQMSISSYIMIMLVQYFQLLNHDYVKKMSSAGQRRNRDRAAVMAAMAVGPGGFPSFPAHFFERSPVWLIGLDQLPRIIFHVLLVAMTPRLHEMLTSARSMCHAPMLRFFRFARWVTRAVSWAQVLTLLVAGMFMSRPAYVPELSVWAVRTQCRRSKSSNSCTSAGRII